MFSTNESTTHSDVREWRHQRLRLTTTHRSRSHNVGAVERVAVNIDVSKDDVPDVGWASVNIDVSKDDVPNIWRASGEIDISENDIPAVGRTSGVTDVLENDGPAFSGWTTFSVKSLRHSTRELSNKNVK
jgi:hypothetical protein